MIYYKKCEQNQSSKTHKQKSKKNKLHKKNEDSTFHQTN